MKYKQILISGFLLWFYSVIGTTMVSVTHQETSERIAENERKVLLRNLYQLLPPDRLDNDIADDLIELAPSALLGTSLPTPAYRARKQGEPVAIIFRSIAPEGYSGEIHLLVGVYENGSLAGVRAVKHAETPGLGDAIETRKSDWIFGFDGRSLGKPTADKWKVKRDGGEFDQITGATITPRAIVKAVKNTLEYYQQNRETLFQ